MIYVYLGASLIYNINFEFVLLFVATLVCLKQITIQTKVGTKNFHHSQELFSFELTLKSATPIQIKVCNIYLCLDAPKISSKVMFFLIFVMLI